MLYEVITQGPTSFTGDFPDGTRWSVLVEEYVPPDISNMQLDGRHRITSYNVCYTKLLRLSTQRGLFGRRTGRRRALPVSALREDLRRDSRGDVPLSQPAGDPLRVITSYSIHYTKLYDSRRRPSKGSPARNGRPSRVRSGSPAGCDKGTSPRESRRRSSRNADTGSARR